MRNYIYFFFALFVFGCLSTKEVSINKANSHFKVVTTPILVEKDTIYINELRFYKIKSARDGMKLMYLNFGKWNKKTKGIHQKNMNGFIWENVKLLDENNNSSTRFKTDMRILSNKLCEIGDNSVIAAGAVINGKFPANSVIGGVPAKIIKSID